MMEIYGSFARVYDLFMDNVPYDTWASFISQLLASHDIRDGLVLDLGCGTGAMTERLSAKGYDMIGADASEEMLEIAREHESDTAILYLQQDMRSFELFGTVRAIVSVCDCFNYLTREDDLLTVCKLANNYLDPGGLLIFDVNTAYKYEQLGDTTIAENRNYGSFIWENHYDPGSQINEYVITLYMQRDSDHQQYERFEEVHYQRAYTLAKLRELIERAGMTFLRAYDDYSLREPNEKSERICIVAQEKGKG